jgi:hypothetical protein
MPTAARTFTSLQKYPRANKATGSPHARQGIFRHPQAYGPTEAAIDKSWKPGDFEKAE